MITITIVILVQLLIWYNCWLQRHFYTQFFLLVLLCNEFGMTEIKEPACKANCRLNTHINCKSRLYHPNCFTLLYVFILHSNVTIMIVITKVICYWELCCVKNSHNCFSDVENFLKECWWIEKVLVCNCVNRLQLYTALEYQLQEFHEIGLK